MTKTLSLEYGTGYVIIMNARVNVTCVCLVLCSAFLENTRSMDQQYPQ